MSRLRWPDSTNSVSDVPGTIQLRRWDALWKLVENAQRFPRPVGAVCASTAPGSLDKNNPRRPSPLVSGEGSMTCRTLTVATRHSGGVKTRRTAVFCVCRSLASDRLVVDVRWV